MKQVRALALSTILVTAGAFPALAADWTTMKAGRFPDTIASAVEQCFMHALHSGTDQLTVLKCGEFRTMLEEGRCEEKEVPDGTYYSKMATTTGEDSTVLTITGQTKNLGSDTSALVCDLGDNLVLHWYTGDEEHCNNVGEVGEKPVAPKPAPPTKKAKAKPKPAEPKLKIGSGGMLQRKPIIIPGTPGMLVPNDCCCGDIFIPGTGTQIIQ